MSQDKITFFDKYCNSLFPPHLFVLTAWHLGRINMSLFHYDCHVFLATWLCSLISSLCKRSPCLSCPWALLSVSGHRAELSLIRCARAWTGKASEMSPLPYWQWGRRCSSPYFSSLTSNHSTVCSHQFSSITKSISLPVFLCILKQPCRKCIESVLNLSRDILCITEVDTICVSVLCLCNIIF